MHPHKGTDRRKVLHRSMGTDIQRWSKDCVRWRSRSFYPLPIWTDWPETLLRLWLRGVCTSDSRLCHIDSKQRLPSEALSVLEALSNNKEPQLMNVPRTVSTSSGVLQWVPAHCAVPGNKVANQLAKIWARLIGGENVPSLRQPASLLPWRTTTTVSSDENRLSFPA